MNIPVTFKELRIQDHINAKPDPDQYKKCHESAILILGLIYNIPVGGPIGPDQQHPAQPTRDEVMHPPPALHTYTHEWHYVS